MFPIWLKSIPKNLFWMPESASKTCYSVTSCKCIIFPSHHEHPCCNPFCKGFQCLGQSWRARPVQGQVSQNSILRSTKIGAKAQVQGLTARKRSAGTLQNPPRKVVSYLDALSQHVGQMRHLHVLHTFLWACMLNHEIGKDAGWVMKLENDAILDTWHETSSLCSSLNFGLA